MTDSKRIEVAIVDNSVIPEIYRPVEHWSRHLDVPWQAYTAREGSLPDPSAFSHIILTGSEASILEREPWVDAEAAMVREAVAAGPRSWAAAGDTSSSPSPWPETATSAGPRGPRSDGSRSAWRGRALSSVRRARRPSPSPAIMTRFSTCRTGSGSWPRAKTAPSRPSGWGTSLFGACSATRRSTFRPGSGSSATSSAAVSRAGRPSSRPGRRPPGTPGSSAASSGPSWTPDPLPRETVDLA